MIHRLGALLLLSILGCTGAAQQRGEVSAEGSVFVWSEGRQAFVPNYIMIDVMGNGRQGPANDLSVITEEALDRFIDTFLRQHGFNGIHVPVYGQWFHIGINTVSLADSIPDRQTFDKLRMIIKKVYEAGGCTHLWLWGDHSRSYTSKSLKGGIMGAVERGLLDEIHRRLNPLQGWTMGYGFDLWEWVGEDELRQWHDYLHSKPGWNHLLGARSSKNQLNQLYEGLDYAAYEYHKPWYEALREMISARPGKPSFSEDRYRIRDSERYRDKDYDAEETRRGLWHHTMAGGVAAIWGKLNGDGTYPNRDAIRCFFTFWDEHRRFRADMHVDNTLSDGYCITNGNRIFVYYKEHTDAIEYRFTGGTKHVAAVDTRKAYKELPVGEQTAGNHHFKAPYPSDWALVVEVK